MGQEVIAENAARPNCRPWHESGRSRLRWRSFFDQRSLCTDTNSPTKNGHASNRCFLPDVGDVHSRETDVSLAVCIGSRAPGVLGAICRVGTANGNPFLIDSITGRSAAFGNDCSKRCNSSPTPPSHGKNRLQSSTAALFGHISMPRAEKGDPTQRSGTLSRRFFDQNSCTCRPRRATATHRTDSWRASRNDQGR
jgi:hypothetical protein